MTYLHLPNVFSNLKMLKLYFELKKKFKYHNLKIMSAFQMWMVGYHHFKNIPIKFFLLKESLA